MIDKTDPTNRDTVPAMLTPGEFVLNKEATEMYGPVIQQMNNAGLQQRAAENKAMEANMGGGVKYYNTGNLVWHKNYTPEVEAAIKKAAKDNNIPIDIYKTLIYLESKGNPLAKNPSSSASGIMQIINSTANEYGLDDPFDLAKNLDVGAKLFSNNYKHLKKSLNREPLASEMYLAHQQGATGALSLLNNSDSNILDVPNMTKEKVEKNGGNTNMTALEFSNMWTEKSDNVFNQLTNPVPKTNEEPQIITSVRPQTRPKTLQKESQPVVMEQPPAALPNPTGYGGYTPQQFLDEAGRINTTTVPSMGDTPPMMQESLPPLPNAGADASFGSAFKEARGRMGAGQVFDYGGKQYTTNFAEEEDMMTANMGGKACSCGKKKVCDCGLGMTYANMGGNIPAQYLNIGDFVRNLMSPFYQKEDKKYLGYGTEPYPYDTVATYPAVTAPGDQGMGIPPAPSSSDPNAGYANYNQQDFLNEANKVNDIVAQPEGYEMPFELPKVNSDQSILDGSSDSVKDAQRMMMLNNPMPNVLPVPDGNPTPLVPPSVDFPPMDESFKGVSIPRSEQDAERMMGINNPMSIPQSVQDSQRMIDINADNAFIPKVNQDTTVPKSNEVDFSMMSTVELLDYLTKTNDPDALLAFEKRPDQNSAIDNAASYVAPNKLDIYQLEKENQTRIDNEVLKRREILDTSTININKKKNEGTLTEADVDAHNKNRKLFLDLEREAETKRREAASNKLQIENQETERQESRILQAEKDYKAELELKKKLKSFNPETGQYEYSEPVPQNILGESGRGSPYEQYGDQVKARIDKLQESTDQNNNQIDSTSIQNLGNKVAKQTPAQVSEAKGLLSSVFGDLFDTKELARAAIMYLGGRATGMSGNQALAFAGKNYLAREAASDQAHKKHLNKLIEDGTMTSASIKIYSKTEDVADLIPKGVTYTSMGETETYYNTRTGNPVQASRVKGSDGGYRWQAPNGEFLVMNRFHQDVDRSSVRPRESINAEINDVEQLFTKLRDDMGTVKGASGGESAVYRTKLTPRLVGESTVEWAMKNNIPVQAVGRVLKGAYQRALADAARKDKPVTAQAIEGYLNDQWIQQSAGDPSDFKTAKDKPIQTTVVNEWVKNLQSKVSEVAPEAFKEMNSINFSTWLRDTDLTKKYHVTEENGGISLEDRQKYIRQGNARTPPMSGYMLFMERQVQTEYRKIVAKRQGTS